MDGITGLDILLGSMRYDTNFIVAKAGYDKHVIKPETIGIESVCTLYDPLLK